MCVCVMMRCVWGGSGYLLRAAVNSPARSIPRQTITLLYCSVLPLNPPKYTSHITHKHKHKHKHTHTHAHTHTHTHRWPGCCCWRMLSPALCPPSSTRGSCQEQSRCVSVHVGVYCVGVRVCWTGAPHHRLVGRVGCQAGRTVLVYLFGTVCRYV